MKRILPGVGALAGLAALLGLAVGCLSTNEYDRNLAAGMKTPETSRLFVKYVEPESGAVSYLLKPGLVAANQQSLYFTHKSMSDDGRFLLFWTSGNEFPNGVGRKPEPQVRGMAVVDFLKDEVIRFDGVFTSIPFLDTKSDVVYYPDVTRQAIFKRDLRANPTKEIEVAKIPQALLAEAEGKPLEKICGHLTLTSDRTRAFLDAKVYDGKWVQGMLKLDDGTWEKWGETDFILNHGQVNPVRDDLALCAHEVRWVDKSGAKHSITNWNGVYPRLQLLEKGKRTMIPPGFSNYATHEHWTPDGKGFYWCNHELGGETYYDLETKTRDILCPIQGYHSNVTADRRYVTFDHPVGSWYRGCHWKLAFWNRETSASVLVYAKSQRLATKEFQSKLHPDPHPQFVCGDRYIVSTFNGPDGLMNVMVTPVAGLVELTATPSVSRLFADLPAEARPEVVARRLSEHFLETPADNYKPKGYKYRNYGGKLVEYPLISLWVNALQAARSMNDTDLEARLIAHFEPFLGEKKAKQSRATHVDFSVFGALPLQIALLNGDPRCAKLGQWYADQQWTPPSEGTLSEKHAFPKERQDAFWAKGYTPQTRLWIDDMYMITLLQSQAWRLTKDEKYLARAAKEMAFYLDELQLKEGQAAGLFYHAPDVPYVWGRGDGWMAAGMALNLKYLPRTNPYRETILCGYRKMMASLLKYQRADGLWGQLVNEPSSWGETSGSAMFTYAFVEGLKNGWLEPDRYGPAARKAYLALVSKLDEYANLKDVCIGTGKKNDHQYYLDRPREAGDPHGQAALMWICAALLDIPPVRAPFGLTVDYRTNPVGVDSPRPRFGWKCPAGCKRQTAYEIEADGWRSGKIAGDANTGVEWNGDELPRSTKIGWRVRVWDESDRVSPWSDRATFVTGLGAGAKWQAKWIGPAASTQPDEDMSAAKWISGQRDAKGVMTLRKSFALKPLKDGAFVEMVHAAYPQHEILINGKSCNLYSGHVHKWNYLRFRDITPWLKTGENTIEVKVLSGGAADAAFLAKLLFPDGSRLVTDATWQGVTKAQAFAEPAYAKDLNLRAETLSPAFEKTFSVEKPLKSAILHITGVGFYEASLNGRKIGEKVLDPAPTAYDKRVLYSTYDIGKDLSVGENTLKVLVGHGWFDVRSIATWDFATAPWRDMPQMIAQLELEYLDGSKARVVSDGSWRHVGSPLMYDCIREGEVLCGTDKGTAVGLCREMMGPKGVLEAEAQPAAKVVRTIEPETIKDCGNGTYVVKFPENFAGWIRAKFRGQKKGDVVIVRYDERVNEDLTPAAASVRDGLHNDQPAVDIRAAKKGNETRRIDCHFRYTASHRFCAKEAGFQTDRLIATGRAVESYEPRFTYNGFQYVVLKGLRQPPTAADIVGCVVSTDFRETGSFACSDETFNRLMLMAKRAYRSNFVDGYPTDCPHREKNGWTGDASIASELAQYLFENTAAYEKWLKDVCDSQNADGDICCIVPTSGWGFKWGNGPAWDSALPVIAWTLYVYRNDRRILDVVYPALVRYLAYTETKADNNGLVKHGLGDWIPVDKMPATELTSSCYYYQALSIAVKMADVKGIAADAAKFAALAEKTRRGINAKYYKGNGVYDNGRQTAQAFPIAYGVVEPSEREKVAAKLVEAVEAKGCHVDMGLLGTKHVFRALSRIGRTDLAFRMLVNPTKPSMVEWIQKGGTTLWEDWGNGASRNHIMFGDFAGWAYQYLAGIGLPETAASTSAVPDVAVRGFEKVVFAPCVIDELSFVTASVDTPQGVFASSWERRDGKLRYRFEVPAGTSAILRLPNRPDEEVGPGVHLR